MGGFRGERSSGGPAGRGTPGEGAVQGDVAVGRAGEAARAGGRERGALAGAPRRHSDLGGGGGRLGLGFQAPAGPGPLLACARRSPHPRALHPALVGPPPPPPSPPLSGGAHRGGGAVGTPWRGGPGGTLTSLAAHTPCPREPPRDPSPPISRCEGRTGFRREWISGQRPGSPALQPLPGFRTAPGDLSSGNQTPPILGV